MALMVAATRHVVLDGRILLRLRELGFFTRIPHRQVQPILILSVPGFQCILGGVAQLTDGWSNALAQLDIELYGSDSVFVRIHELLSSSPSFRPRPQWVTSGWKSTAGFYLACTSTN